MNSLIDQFQSMAITLGDAKKGKQKHGVVKNIDELKQRLPDICNEIMGDLGTQQLEGSYQRALQYELQDHKITVLSEVTIPLMYKGRQIGKRRADLIIELESKQRAILELKAVKQISNDNLKQLYYYMDHFKVEHGFLVNFPHESGFPESDLEFKFETLSGSFNVSDRKTRKSVDLEADILYVSPLK